MKQVYVAGDSIVSPLGFTSEENYSRVLNGDTGISFLERSEFSRHSFFASYISSAIQSRREDLSRFDNLCIDSAERAMADCNRELDRDKTLFILSTTKGNIEYIETATSANFDLRKPNLYRSASLIANWFGFTEKPLVLSNACISGVLAQMIAVRYLQSGMFENVVITGADVLSAFVVSGFHALGAMSNEPCRPFDEDRKGITLGECAATVILTTNATLSKGISISGYASTNDANHISGPSRTGEELAYAIQEALDSAGLISSDLAFVNAHGTATLFNDEMEAKAFWKAGLKGVFVNSLKGNFGHTLGAAGILESIISYHALKKAQVLKSRNYEKSGVSEPIYIATQNFKTSKSHLLKTGSGFGGGNAAIIFSLN